MKAAQEAKAIWNNKIVPVVLRRGGSQPIRLRLPWAHDNRNWLQNGTRKKEPAWEPKSRYWELPATRFNEIVTMLLSRFGQVYIVQPYREKEICARACREAHGFECNCSCMGANHGISHSGGWYDVSDSFAIRFSETKLACRLLKKVHRLEED